MVELPETLEKIFKWIGPILALVGGIMAAVGFGGYSATLDLSTNKGFMSFLLVWMLELIGYIIVVMVLLDGTYAVLGIVLAIFGGGIMTFLLINEELLEGGGEAI